MEADGFIPKDVNCPRLTTRVVLPQFSLVRIAASKNSESEAAMDTNFWVHDQQIYGPLSYTGFFIQDGQIHGPEGKTDFQLEGVRIHGPEGDTGYRIEDNRIFGPTAQPPWSV